MKITQNSDSNDTLKMVVMLRKNIILIFNDIYDIYNFIKKYYYLSY